ncbi:MAG: 2-C-methyl-D-erythritol 4-phosphate cytidylyltransferase [Chloroflexota bacterium]
MSGRLAAIIVAAGKSQRMGGVDKQLRTIGGMPVLARTVAAFEACEDVGAIVLVVNPDNIGGAAELRAEYGWQKVRVMVPGGERRQDSVGAGLAAVVKMSRSEGGFEWVAVHDGARPMLSPDLISRGFEMAQEVGAAIAALRAIDTVKSVDGSGTITGTIERSNIWLAQTPQIFRVSILSHAYEMLVGREEPLEATDCARIVELSGHPVKVFEGEPTNIKITTPLDLLIAEAILKGLGRS